jgi:hypothetical protein
MIYMKVIYSIVSLVLVMFGIYNLLTKDDKDTFWRAWIVGILFDIMSKLCE